MATAAVARAAAGKPDQGRKGKGPQTCTMPHAPKGPRTGRRQSSTRVRVAAVRVAAGWAAAGETVAVGWVVARMVAVGWVVARMVAAVAALGTPGAPLEGSWARAAAARASATVAVVGAQQAAAATVAAADAARGVVMEV